MKLIANFTDYFLVNILIEVTLLKLLPCVRLLIKLQLNLR